MLIAISIVSILILFSLPQLTHIFTRAHRQEASSQLLILAERMEAYQMQQDTYSGATLSALHVSSHTAQNHYQLNIQSADQSHYVLLAKPVHGEDSECGTLILNEQGEKRITGKGRLSECWY